MYIIRLLETICIKLIFSTHYCFTVVSMVTKCCIFYHGNKHLITASELIVSIETVPKVLEKKSP